VFDLAKLLLNYDLTRQHHRFQLLFHFHHLLLSVVNRCSWLHLIREVVHMCLQVHLRKHTVQ
jgi:hypothetical protein